MKSVLSNKIIVIVIILFQCIYIVETSNSNGKQSRRSKGRAADRDTQRDSASKPDDKSKGDAAHLKDQGIGYELVPDSCSRGAPGSPGSQGIQGIQGVQGVQGPVGIAGAQGSPGRNGKKGEPGRDGRRGRKGDPAILSGETLKDIIPKVAFSVALDFDMAPSNEYRVVVFNIPLFDPAELYNTVDGVFTAPVNGTYLVGFHGVSYHGNNALLHLVKNDQRVLSAFGNSGCACCEDIDVKELECAGSASNVGILGLVEGDKLWIELPDRYGLHNAPYHSYATFYGYRILV